jgi:hypothetical protein
MSGEWRLHGVEYNDTPGSNGVIIEMCLAHIIDRA